MCLLNLTLPRCPLIESSSPCDGSVLFAEVSDHFSRGRLAGWGPPCCSWHARVTGGGVGLSSCCSAAYMHCWPALSLRAVKHRDVSCWWKQFSVSSEELVLFGVVLQVLSEFIGQGELWNGI